MSKNIVWQNIEGAFEKKRKLKLRASEEDNTFKCPVKYCDHEGFKTERSSIDFGIYLQLSGFSLQNTKSKNGFKDQKPVGQKPYKNFNKII